MVWTPTHPASMSVRFTINIHVAHVGIFDVLQGYVELRAGSLREGFTTTLFVRF